MSQDRLPPFAVVLVMAGAGQRFGGDLPKVFLPLGGEPMWRRSARTLSGLPGCVGLVLVAAARHVDDVAAAAADLPGARVVAGGARRQDSVRAGLAALPAAAELVAVHDAARPLVDRETALRTLRAAARGGAALAAVPARDTVKRADGEGRVVETLDRARLHLAQTPQAFRIDLLRRAHAEAARAGAEATDDAALVERLGETVEVVAGARWNLKVTEPEDLRVAEALLERRRAAGEAGL